ncbi:hypothetical protein SAMN05216516_101352 [Izhakiella capsodis]|uniref:Uncharacterized protein n=1 Tax=Izhakiella capsodis TaxID=1367852 RepID=A0A1I4UUN8_9GAMM|nr:hypothetical protein SAMN05216516_101352 [Izhakiella capsodis]
MLINQYLVHFRLTPSQAIKENTCLAIATRLDVEYQESVRYNMAGGNRANVSSTALSV